VTAEFASHLSATLLDWCD